MIVPPDSLSPYALEGLIQEFVTRDGTDYGDHETDMATRVKQVKALLDRKEVVILYSEATEQVNIVSKESLR